jgi:hypothetical protein
MGKAETPDILWLPDVEEHNYPAAGSYLGLLYPDDRVAALVGALRQAPLSKFKAKDIFRASKLSLLGISNSHVEKDIRKIEKGVPLSPLLLVRDASDSKVIIADGYHRLCAVYTFSEDCWIPCRIV